MRAAPCHDRRRQARPLLLIKNALPAPDSLPNFPGAPLSLRHLDDLHPGVVFYSPLPVSSRFPTLSHYSKFLISFFPPYAVSPRSPNYFSHLKQAPLKCSKNKSHPTPTLCNDSKLFPTLRRIRKNAQEFSRLKVGKTHQKPFRKPPLKKLWSQHPLAAQAFSAFFDELSLFVTFCSVFPLENVLL